MKPIPFSLPDTKADPAAPDAPGVAAATCAVVRPVLRRIAAFSAVAALCVPASGCVSDLGAQIAGQSSGQLRYYGGPKSPMWRTQEVGHEQS